MSLAAERNLSKNKLLDEVGLGKSLFDNMKEGTLLGGTVVQGTHHSSVVVNNGCEAAHETAESGFHAGGRNKTRTLKMKLKKEALI